MPCALPCGVVGVKGSISFPRILVKNCSIWMSKNGQIILSIFYYSDVEEMLLLIYVQSDVPNY